MVPFHTAREQLWIIKGEKDIENLGSWPGSWFVASELTQKNGTVTGAGLWTPLDIVSSPTCLLESVGCIKPLIRHPPPCEPNYGIFLDALPTWVRGFRSAEKYGTMIFESKHRK
jgi:hypothetical protein